MAVVNKIFSLMTVFYATKINEEEELKTMQFTMSLPKALLVFGKRALKISLA